MAWQAPLAAFLLKLIIHDIIWGLDQETLQCTLTGVWSAAKISRVCKSMQLTPGSPVGTFDESQVFIAGHAHKLE